jgi:hypothetical protein
MEAFSLLGGDDTLDTMARPHANENKLTLMDARKTPMMNNAWY